MTSTQLFQAQRQHANQDLQPTLERMRTLVRDLEQAIHAGRSTETLWAQLRDCNDMIVFVREGDVRRVRAQAAACELASA